ncbi:MAG TPA: hypothetical protein VE198_24135 [Actinoallomurus sp.]|jgi:hypothetical protein|nr:hypothetical protein [Actinoallomurus sp.]
MLRGFGSVPVFPVLKQKYGNETVNEMIIVLGQEIVRQKPVGRLRQVSAGQPGSAYSL